MRIALICLLAASPAFAQDGPLRYLPSDTRVVLTVHVGRLSAQERQRGQGLVRRLYRTHLCRTLGEDDPLPMRDLERIVVALPYAGTFNGVILIQGKIDRKRFEGQMDRAAKAAGEVRVEKAGRPEVPVYRCKVDEKALLGLVPALARVPASVRKLIAPQEVSVAVLDDRTLIASLAGPTPVVRALRARPAASPPRVSAELAKLLRQPHRADVATLVLMDDSLHPALQLLSDAATRDTFDEFDHVQFHLRGGKTVEVETSVQGKSSDLGPTLEKKARRVVEVIREQLPKVMRDEKRRSVIDRLVGSFRIDRDGGRVTVKGTMTEADAKRFVEGDRERP